MTGANRVPGAEETSKEGPAPVVRHLREIVLWPLQIVAKDGWRTEDCCGVFEKAARGTPWYLLGDGFTGEAKDFRERHYREFISFLPHAKRFLYGEPPARGARPKPGDIPATVYRREDIKKVRITLERGMQPVLCGVARVDLHFFYDIDVVILACEIFAGDIPLDAAESLIQRFGRAYPAGWTNDGAPIHCPSEAEWLDAEGKVLMTSDYTDQERFLSFTGEHRAPCVARHWEYVLAPIVNGAQHSGAPLQFREIEYYRMPVMSYLALDSLSTLKQSDYLALGLATQPAKTRVPFSKRFLKKFEARNIYGRLYSGGLDAPEIETRFLTTGEAFTIVSGGDSPSLTDNERGLLSQFRHQYFLMFIVAHFHKATLFMLSDRLVAALKKLDPEKREAIDAFRNETLALQENFLRFSQRYYFREISGRAHVRDLFRMVRKHLGMDALFKELRNEIFDLVQYLDSNALRRQNASMYRLTVVTIAGLVGTIVTGFLGMNLIEEAHTPLSYKLKYFGLVTAGVSVLVALTVIYSRQLTAMIEKFSGDRT